MTSLPHRAGRVPLHPQAFSHDLGIRRKRPRVTDQEHLKFLRTLPCLVCGSRKDIQAAHIRSGSSVYGKRRTGMGEKPADRFALPLCREHHAQQHQGDELLFWASLGIDPFQTALALFAASGDDEAAELVVRMARK